MIYSIDSIEYSTLNHTYKKELHKIYNLRICAFEEQAKTLYLPSTDFNHHVPLSFSIFFSPSRSASPASS